MILFCSCVNLDSFTSTCAIYSLSLLDQGKRSKVSIWLIGNQLLLAISSASPESNIPSYTFLVVSSSGLIIPSPKGVGLEDEFFKLFSSHSTKVPKILSDAISHDSVAISPSVFTKSIGESTSREWNTYCLSTQKWIGSCHSATHSKVSIPPWIHLVW